MNRASVAFIVAGVMCAMSGTASAGPWILPERVAVTRITAGGETASEEFLFDGTRQAYPLEGRFSSYFLDVFGAYGLTERVEVGASLQVKGVSFTSEPVLLLPDRDNPPNDLQGYRDSVFNFSRERTGLGDLRLQVGYQHYAGALHVASAVIAKLPSGYEPPDQTFEEGSPSPTQVSDDVALGDGQFDLDYHLYLGHFFSDTFTLAQLDLGYRARFNGPGHQGLAAVKLGQGVDENLLFFVEGDAAYTLFDGEVLGQAYVARNPELPASRFDESTIDVVDFTLDKDWVTLRGGAILRLGGREIVLTASRTLWARNYPVLTGVSVGTILVFD